MQSTTYAAQKNSSEKKDNYIVKGWFWDPECVIV
ncbi:hypothetical protein Kpol_1039p70b [Vanderwaltozyma polyspora DSM 70294]|uniref:Uncharacterized protein n=1 Tax=Vanderwaltozyma polyspora (strain ATCC 22028 / DSM 70294 / BCRC 21397 / CBS 2163 / NBRC 10782 / NRRL Y-8283 / UCD 57-17) TaxID=436907 RepID=A7THJ5_VANPO|nr:uncharacterized protein Kpol_1039p70 [Vanderwaltozyma polyspora DSM 70294]XP_001646179.1 uncharacterized protein Kpol_1039p70b [Vanderwaltozyma polyspora DSM 70294]EDO18319.1 hypothetical protein Kpol_1039p70 [Vanderwaltozyma polyspora DSM 70294]EDO18321.1 hypothetical protein Kpol_1039p70b [Vanderwaltozyma polyspora DSM 70294]